MAVSRPLLLALMAAILALVAFYATSGGREPATGSGKPAEPAAERPSTPAAPGSGARGKADGRVSGAPGRPPKRGATRPPAAAGRSAPPAVMRAVARKRTVVLFFFQRGSADDAATARSVSSLRGRRGVQVFSAPISRLGDYGEVIGGAGVSQAPAVVIRGRGRAVRLIEGFVDRETLTQQVADAR